ncbi:MAG: hypothetical protein OHK0023_00700 [Anaerolineae bacterium]
MPFQVETHLNEAILILRYQSITSEDLAAGIETLQNFYQKLQQPFAVISNVAGLQLPFDFLVSGLDMLRRTMKGVPAHFSIVGSGEMVELGAKALGQKQYGFEVARVFASEAEAIAWSREQLAAHSA